MKRCMKLHCKYYRTLNYVWNVVYKSTIIHIATVGNFEMYSTHSTQLKSVLTEKISVLMTPRVSVRISKHAILLLLFILHWYCNSLEALASS